MTNDNVLSHLGIREINELFAEHHELAIIWSAKNVLALRPDLTLKQGWEVLQQCRNGHDACEGITWDVIDYVAKELFPLPDGADYPE